MVMGTKVTAMATGILVTETAIMVAISMGKVEMVTEMMEMTMMAIGDEDVSDSSNGAIVAAIVMTPGTGMK